jgi:hypothetical protein
MMALGSKASFNYSPSDDEILAYYQKNHRLIKHNKNTVLIDLIPKEKRNEIKNILIEA